MKKESDVQFPDEWKIVIARNFEEIEAIRPIWEEMQHNESCPTPNTDIDRFLAVAEHQESIVQPCIILLKHYGRPRAMVIGRIEKLRIKCAIGYRALFNPSVCSLSVVYGGILGERTSDVCVAMIEKFMDMLARREVDVVFLNHIATDSLIYKHATKMPDIFCRGHFPRNELHWSMTIPQDVDLLYKSFAPKTRNTLRRKNRKLEKEFGDELQIITYSGRDDVPHAVSAASRISQYTYQAGLGVGIVDDRQTRKILDVSARHGWLRMSILYIKDEPCAFQLGLQYGQTYFLEQLGFLPKWTRWNVGTVLFNKILEDLCRDPSVERFNFGFGDAQYKRSYGSECWSEASVCIFAPRAYPLLVNALESSTAGLSFGIQYVLDRTNLAGWIKRKWRGLLRPKSSKARV
jgi:hypothetical protein